MQKKQKIRNPFAGQKQTGSGFHTSKKYTKKDRQRIKDESEELIDEKED